MVRVGGGVVVRQVAAGAVGRGSGEALLTWHWAHATVVCAPVSGNASSSMWSNLAPCHCVVVWQSVQSCGNPAATWFGLVVAWKFFRWQPDALHRRSRCTCR